MCSDGAWELNFDSAPFCNGSLHLGHVRNYALGDVRARWLRKQGVDVSYRSAYDAFGLPNEIGAAKSGIPARTFVQEQTDWIRSQLVQLRLSYSSPLPTYCDPSYYKWTQWLFLQMWDAGLIYHRFRPTPFCKACNAFLATNQNEDERCWRCGGKSGNKWSRQWYIRTSEYWDRLFDSIDGLSSWSERGRNLLRAHMKRADTASRTNRRFGYFTSSRHRNRDWLVSRNRMWGTPMPLVECKKCGISPVPESELPVKLECHGGNGSACCSTCANPAPLVSRSLDCFFDDAWCFFAAARIREPGENPFIAWFANPPTWVHFHAGYDTYAYLHVFRFVSYFLFDQGYSPRAEPIDFFHGHDVVTSCKKKMSKRNGNTPDLDELLRIWGSDVIRLSVLANANPGKQVCWSDERLSRGAQLVVTLTRLLRCVPDTKVPKLSQSEIKRINKMRNQLWRVDQFIEQYRIGAAIELLYTLTSDTLRLARSNKHAVASAARDKLLPYWKIVAPAIFESLPSSTSVDDVIQQSSPGDY